LPVPLTPDPQPPAPASVSPITGRPGMRTELFSSKCPDTIIVQETDRDYQRILLYSRTPDLADECIEDFRSQAYCLDMEEFLLIPRSQDTCQLQDS
ncbi:apolipoprotein M, partial [Terrapene carolina triunguis]|uniref:apolipoprotein M n=1 Tax=Terrapene triunguis TaxID=2587831 RepID=UPI0011564477